MALSFRITRDTKFQRKNGLRLTATHWSWLLGLVPHSRTPRQLHVCAGGHPGPPATQGGLT
eukprot:scaffold421256_cov54-Attheya_sp.AAC.4